MIVRYCMCTNSQNSSGTNALFVEFLFNIAHYIHFSYHIFIYFSASLLSYHYQKLQICWYQCIVFFIPLYLVHILLRIHSSLKFFFRISTIHKTSGGTNSHFVPYLFIRFLFHSGCTVVWHPYFTSAWCKKMCVCACVRVCVCVCVCARVSGGSNSFFVPFLFIRMLLHAGYKAVWHCCFTSAR